MRSVFSAVTLALTYISFEPFVRRRWPQTMISWSRVLAGGFRDPLVGRDLLVGCLSGVVLALIQGFGNLLYGIHGTTATKISTDLVTLSGGRFLAGEFLYLFVDTLNKSLGILFLIFLFRVLLRKQWLAAGVVIIVAGWNLRRERPESVHRVAGQHSVLRLDGVHSDAIRTAGRGRRAFRRGLP